MCVNPFKQPKQSTPAPVVAAAAPPPAAASAATAQGDVVRADDNDSAVQKSRRKGRNALRIKLDAGNVGGATGLNIPQA
jgi:hypothetical protein